MLAVFSIMVVEFGILNDLGFHLCAIVVIIRKNSFKMNSFYKDCMFSVHFSF